MISPRGGGPPLKIGQKNHFFSRIHVEDIANILFKSLDNFKNNEIYNICSNNPQLIKKVFELIQKRRKVKLYHVAVADNGDFSQNILLLMIQSLFMEKLQLLDGDAIVGLAVVTSNDQAMVIL